MDSNEKILAAIVAFLLPCLIGFIKYTNRIINKRLDDLTDKVGKHNNRITKVECSMVTEKQLKTDLKPIVENGNLLLQLINDIKISIAELPRRNNDK